MFDNPRLFLLHQLIGYVVGMFVSLICCLERQRLGGGAGGRGEGGLVDTSATGRPINEECPRSSSSSSSHFPLQAPATTASRSTFQSRSRFQPQTDRMHAPHRPGGPSGYSVRNYAPATVFSHYSASQCASSTKPPPGKSFTIDALLARTEETSSSSRGRLPPPAADRYYPAAPLVPLGGRGGLAAAPAPYLCSPAALLPASHLQAGCSLYCCPPLSYQPTCRGAFYAQGKTDELELLRCFESRPECSWREIKVVIFFSCLCSVFVQSQRWNSLLQNQRREVEADPHELHQRAAVAAGEGVRPPAVHGGLGEVPAGLGPAAHRGSGEQKQKNKQTQKQACVPVRVAVRC